MNTETNGSSAKGRVVSNGKGKRMPTGEEMVTASEPAIVNIDPKRWLPKVVSIDVQIRGITPIIVNNFSHKSRQQMLDAQMQKAKGKKPPKDPQANFEGSKYIDYKKRDCIHMGGIRNAMIQAARNIDGVTMASLKQGIFVEGPEGPAQVLLPIEYEKCVMREDVVRNESGVADIRHRAEYQNWSCKFRLHVIENVVSAEQAYQLLAMAGFAVGLHEWRPAGKNGLGGQFGRFEIVVDGANGK
jgi:hypothetical protein